MIRKILCPTDFSNHSKAGVASALSLAKAKSAELVLFHVTSFPFSECTTYYEAELVTGTRYTPRFTVDSLLAAAETKLRNFLSGEFGNEIKNLDWRLKVGLGKVSAEIVAAACQEHADLIVMGKQKGMTLQRFLHRSVSEAVSCRAPCTVLTVCPPQVTESADSQGRKGSGIPVWAGTELHGYS